MSLKKLFFLLVTGSILLTACKSKKPPVLSGEEPVAVSDFIDFFQPLDLTYQAGDTILDRKEKDSLRISYKIFTRIVPDTVLSKVFGKGTKPKIYALGKARVSQAETYILVKGITPAKKALLLLAFDAGEKFIAAMPVLVPDNRRETTQTFILDKRFAITRTVQRKNRDGSLSEGKEVYVLNADAGQFLLILTEALEDKVTELINPIDTFSRKHKYAADYGTGKMNLVSVRDGRKNDRISFFIHLEKDNGNCTGELKGEAKWLGPGKAIFREDGDPCVLTFVFSSNSVSLSEAGCGARHGLNCTFNGSYTRRKYIKPVSPGTKTSARKGSRK
ncbi:MAG: hypothetical protein HYZ15_07930 [Sphingobacteriales bacterium]|nr:hypothetical protein [Sphingobacteriales bacterium]